jgi:hypothetical protein
MRLLRRRAEPDAGAQAVVPPAPEQSLEALNAEIADLVKQGRSNPSRHTERRLLKARHRAGIRLLQDAPEDPQFTAPIFHALPDEPGLAELSKEQLTPGLVRAGILRDGCALVRELIPRTDAVRLAGLIDRAFAERDRLEVGEVPAEGYYEEFEADPRFEAPGRPWIKVGGGLLAADSPLVCFAMMDAFAAAGIPQLVSGYLGEPALTSVHKTTLRKAEPSVAGAWHQDGFFMGPVRSLNLWLSLSRCGDEAPGLDILPRRLDAYLATGTEDAKLNWTISDHQVEEAATGTAVMRPIFQPGDALFFDELFLHKTGSDQSMPNPRFAVESWFFGPSQFPDEYAPLTV